MDGLWVDLSRKTLFRVRPFAVQYSDRRDYESELWTTHKAVMAPCGAPKLWGEVMISSKALPPRVAVDSTADRASASRRLHPVPPGSQDPRLSTSMFQSVWPWPSPLPSVRLSSKVKVATTFGDRRKIHRLIGHELRLRRSTHTQ